MPFFTIVVPTRNRPEYVADCIYSLVGQTFADLEVIVSDNSTTEEHSKATRAAVEPFLCDPRVSYIRPDTPLSMTDHWNWATSHSKGHYVGITTDRMVLRLYALAHIYETVIEHPDTNAVSFASCVAKSVGSSILLPKSNLDLGSVSMRSSDVLNAFSSSDLPKNNPRFLNSFCSRKALAKILEQYGSVFESISPDYAFLFRYLNMFEDYRHVFHHLLVVQGEERSNGKAFLTGIMNEDSADFSKWMSTTQSEWLSYGPIPGDTSVMSNVMLREYSVGQVQGAPGRFPTIDKVKFYLKAHSRAVELNRQGLLSNKARMTIQKFALDNDLQGQSLPPPPSAFTLKMRQSVKALKALIRPIKPSGRNFVSGVNMCQALTSDLVAHMAVCPSSH